MRCGGCLPVAYLGGKKGRKVLGGGAAAGRQALSVRTSLLARFTFRARARARGAPHAWAFGGGAVGRQGRRQQPSSDCLERAEAASSVQREILSSEWRRRAARPRAPAALDRVSEEEEGA